VDNGWLSVVNSVAYMSNALDILPLGSCRVDGSVIAGAFDAYRIQML
jgi:hypothetical protein